MIGTANVVTLAKYGFLSLVVTGAGFLVANVTIVKHYKKGSADSLVYKPPQSSYKEDVLFMLDTGFSKCLTKPTGTFCALASELKLEPIQTKEQMDSIDMDDVIAHAMNITSSTRHQRRQLVQSLLKDFFKICSLFNVHPVLLEPSMLFCMLTPSNKLKLLTKGFNPVSFQGSRDVVTIGILAEDSKRLDKELILNAARDAGYEVSRVRRWLKMSELDSSKHEEDFYTIRFFFTRQGVTVHVLVFFEVGSFLWHAGAYEEDTGMKDIIFVNESAYENFTFEQIELGNPPDYFNFYLPSDPIHFLLQIPTSTFRKCGQSLEHVVTRSVAKRHSSLTEEQLNNRAVVGIQELKVVLDPHPIPFWLWTATLTGWYEDCDIFRRTTELNFAIELSKNSFNFSEILTDSEYLELVDHQMMNDKDWKFILECHGLKINVIVTYKEMSTLWYYDEDHKDRLVYSKFDLCSANVIGQKVYVPCDPLIRIQPEEHGR